MTFCLWLSALDVLDSLGALGALNVLANYTKESTLYWVFKRMCQGINEPNLSFFLKTNRGVGRSSFSIC
jgi:hypothetical protein